MIIREKLGNQYGSILYESPGEILTCDDSNFIATDPDIYDPMYNLVPESFKNLGEYYKQLSILSANIITREILIANDINNVLDADKGSISVLNFLAQRYNIIFPYNYDVNAQRLILKYYPNFVKIKGSSLIVNILNFIGRTEHEFYMSAPGTYEITQIYEGYLNITIDEANKERINNFKNFAQTLINNLMPSGMYAEIVIN